MGEEVPQTKQIIVASATPSTAAKTGEKLANVVANMLTQTKPELPPPNSSAEMRGLPSTLAELTPQMSQKNQVLALKLLSTKNSPASEEEVGALLVTNVRSGDSIQIQFGQFEETGLKKGASHELTIQRLGDTQVPDVFYQVNDPTQLTDATLVAIIGSHTFVPTSGLEKTQPLDSRTWEFQIPGSTPDTPTVAMMPLCVAIPTDQPKQPEVIIATRYPKDALKFSVSRQLVSPRATKSIQADIIPDA